MGRGGLLREAVRGCDSVTACQLGQVSSLQPRRAPSRRGPAGGGHRTAAPLAGAPTVQGRAYCSAPGEQRPHQTLAVWGQAHSPPADVVS